ncbi:GAL3ST1 [Branchiostoma lanceolatum]|uniref:GAL3ST1 protein n=1 Tax=Branchiostoma lanceolatum TaxID=7740 RepID=A0A8K0AFL1_BRALA|nr:GAL3ST1 [Branchiostoma lanceolatum]
MWNHFTYNKTWLRSRFPADTAYISIIREPSNQLRSATNYYYLPQLMKIKSKNPVKTFLENPWKYKKLSEAHFAYCNVTWDPSRNFMSFDLGYPAEGAEDKERAQKYIRELETDFTLVLLLDYLDESLVLLGRLMCWELQDILYVHKNNRHYSYKTYVPSQKELAKLRRWKAVDYLLFDTFNASLWRKIAAQGKDFFDEVKHFKEVNTQVSTYCSERKKGEQNLTVAASKWSSQFEVDAEFCRIIQSVVRELLQPVQKGHERGRKLLSEKVNIKALINGQPTFKYMTERENYLHMAKSSRKTKSEGKIIKKKQNINEDTKKGGG